MSQLKTKIVPAILVKNKAEFQKQFAKIKKDFTYIQVDIMDGVFVKEKNDIRPDTIKSIIRGYKLEIHLMVDAPSKYAVRWAGLSNVKKIIWHYEANVDHERIMALNKFLKNKKIQTGLAIKPNTSLAKIKNLIPEFHTIQIMAIKPGGQGRKFQPSVLPKIKALRSKYKDLNIAVDGGVNDRNFLAIKKAGANIIAVGSYLQNANNLKSALAKLKI
ncbi:hypothetical protein C4566_03595 [Candidatus Parcubacteria bacterium]|nr:MAG: hypothetical protein C4566_03595 [Candidatus Parcubacteria bacterium]